MSVVRRGGVVSLLTAFGCPRLLSPHDLNSNLLELILFIDI